MNKITKILLTVFIAALFFACLSREMQSAYSLSPGTYVLETKATKTGVEKPYEDRSRVKLILDGNNLIIVLLEKSKTSFRGTVQDGYITLVFHEENPNPMVNAMQLKLELYGKITARDYATGTIKGYAGTNNYLNGTWDLKWLE